MQRDLIWLSGLVATAFAVLAGLGLWQLQRLEWKQGLSARIEARAHGEPVSLDEALARWNVSRDVDYLRVRFEGRFDHGNERHLFHVLDGKTGWRVITPVETPSGRIVMADRGFVPDALKPPQTRQTGQVDGRQSLAGLARAAGPQGLFTPDNRPDANEWYWRDLDGMAASALSAGETQRLVPFFVELEADGVPGGWPKGGVTRLRLPNHHLQYALTWFALAGALLAVFAVFVIGRLRRPFT